MKYKNLPESQFYFFFPVRAAWRFWRVLHLLLPLSPEGGGRRRWRRSSEGGGGSERRHQPGGGHSQSNHQQLFNNKLSVSRDDWLHTPGPCRLCVILLVTVGWVLTMKVYSSCPKISFRGKCARTGHPLKIPSATKLGLLGHFRPEINNIKTIFTTVPLTFGNSSSL